MKGIKFRKIIRALLAISALLLSLLIAFFFSLNFIVDPIVYWLVSTETIRKFIAFIIAWLQVSILFDLFYMAYKRRKKNISFNALNVPYPRKFRGRK